MRDKKKPQGKFTYKSMNTGEYVMCHQWIAEVLVQRKLEREQKPAPDKYWKNPKDPISKEHKKQLVQAARLIKRFSEEAILNFLKNNKYKFSLFPKNNVELIEKEQDIIDRRITDKVVEVEDANVYIQRKTNKTNLLGKLNGK